MSGWCFTLNNPPSFGDILPEWNCECRVYQHEKGASGTHHLQGFVYFASRKTLTSVRKLLPSAHWEKAKALDLRDAWDYCTKKENGFSECTPEQQGPFTFGDKNKLPPPKKQGHRKDLIDACELAKSGRFSEIDPVAFMRYHKGLFALSALHLKSRTSKPTVIWYHGPTGCGKSKLASESSSEEDVYWKPPGKWWDGYRQQSTVVIDDLRPEDMPFNYWLRICDRYPFTCEVKGGTVPLNSPTIIITAPHPPAQLFYKNDAEDLAQLERRCTLILELTR
jgi:hypothetical protein